MRWLRRSYRVAAAVGLGSPETLYRIFHRHLGIPPGEYRARFTNSEGERVS